MATDRGWPVNRARVWDSDRAAAVGLRIAAWLFDERPERKDHASDIAAAVGNGGSWLDGEQAYRAKLDDLLPWTCCDERIDRAVAEVYSDAPTRESSPRTLAEFRPAAEVARNMVSDAYGINVGNGVTDWRFDLLAEGNSPWPITHLDKDQAFYSVDGVREWLEELIRRERSAAFDAGVHSVREERL